MLYAIINSSIRPSPRIPKEMADWFDAGRITMMQRIEERSVSSYLSDLPCTVSEAQLRATTCGDETCTACTLA